MQRETPPRTAPLPPSDRITRANLGRALYSMTWPMMFGVLALMSYQLVDSIYISMLGTEPLAALGFTVAVNQLAIGIQVGLGIATTALISRAIGADNMRRARKLGGLVLISGSTVMGALCILTWLGRDLILTLLDADPTLWPLIGRYWGPWLLSLWLSAILYFTYSVARAQGNTKLPGSVMLVTSLLNMAFDPIFIFVFDWGLPGAAWASNVTFLIGLAIMWRYIKYHKWVRYRNLQGAAWSALRDLGAITGPAMLSQLMPGIAAMAATKIVAGFGAAAVAAWALTTRLEFFSIVVVLALTMSLPPMVGRYLGAADYTSMDRLVRVAVKFTLVLQLLLAFVGFGLALVLPSALSDDTQVRNYLHTWLMLVPLSYGSLGTCMIVVSVSNAMGMPLRAVVVSLLRLFLFYLPAVWLGAVTAGMTGVYAGVLLGNLVAGGVSWLIYKQATQHLVQAATHG